MFRIKINSPSDPNFTFEADTPDEYRWIERNGYRVMDTYTQTVISEQCMYLGISLDVSKMTFAKYLEYGREFQGYLQFLADFEGTPVDPDDQGTKEYAYMLWMNLTRGLGFTKSNIDEIANLANSMYRNEVEQHSIPSWAIQLKRKIQPKCNLRLA